MARASTWTSFVCIGAALLMAAPASAAWYKGNTHTHSLNSDGDVAPDDVVRWYREHGYQFVVMTEHEYITDAAPLQAIFGAAEQFLVMQGPGTDTGGARSKTS